MWYNKIEVFYIKKVNLSKGDKKMTTKQKIEQKAAEVSERREARRSGIRLEIIEKVAMGILELLDVDMITTLQKAIPVERVNVHCNRMGEICLQVETKGGIYAEHTLYSREIAEKMKQLNGISINKQENKYLQEILGKYYQVIKIEDGFAVE